MEKPREAAMTERKTILSELVSISEMAEILGVSKRTIERQIQEGKLPPTVRLPGRRRFWTRSTIEAFLRGASIKPKEAENLGKLYLLS